jgi:hypothetical protein
MVKAYEHPDQKRPEQRIVLVFSQGAANSQGGHYGYMRGEPVHYTAKFVDNGNDWKNDYKWRDAVEVARGLQSEFQRQRADNRTEDRHSDQDRREERKRAEQRRNDPFDWTRYDY